LISIIDNIKDKLLGLLLVVLIGLISQTVSSNLPVKIGPIATAIIFGALLNNLFTIKRTFRPGINFSEKYLLSAAIILMGFNLNLYTVNIFNNSLLLDIVYFVVLAFFITFLISKIFNLPTGLSILLSIGNAICGSSAIASVSAIIDSKKEDVLLSVSSINIIGALSIFLLPFALQFYSITDINSQGLIIGGTVQAVGQVSAAGSIISSETGEFAVFVKMFRILLLFPALIIIIIIKHLFKVSITNNRYKFNFPYFIIGFIIVCLINNYNFFNEDLTYLFKNMSKYFLLLSMTALGLQVSFKEIAKNGIRIFTITLFAFIIQVFLVIQIVT